MRIIQKRIKKIEDANTDDTSLCLIAKKETKENNGNENENQVRKKMKSVIKISLKEKK